MWSWRGSLVWGQDNMEKIAEQFDQLIATLEALKSDKRTAQDRYVAITITMLEQARAVFLTYVAAPQATERVNWNK